MRGRTIPVGGEGQGIFKRWGEEHSLCYSRPGSTELMIAWWVQAIDAPNSCNYSEHHGLRGSNRSSVVRWRGRGQRFLRLTRWVGVFSGNRSKAAVARAPGWSCYSPARLGSREINADRCDNYSHPCRWAVSSWQVESKRRMQCARPAIIQIYGILTKYGILS